eukprot:COSAG04_NODE_681_length_11192_cov_30.820337_7_plen_105_part_00
MDSVRIELEEGLAELPKFDAKPPNELVLGETVLEWLKRRLRTFLRNRKECAPHLCRRRLFASWSLCSCRLSMLDSSRRKVPARRVSLGSLVWPRCRPTYLPACG